MRECDKCDKEAVVNYQKVWTRFDVLPTGAYIFDKTFEALDVDEPVGEGNLHFCKEHEEEWLKGEVTIKVFKGIANYSGSMNWIVKAENELDAEIKIKEKIADLTNDEFLEKLALQLTGIEFE